MSLLNLCDVSETTHTPTIWFGGLGPLQDRGSIEHYRDLGACQAKFSVQLEGRLTQANLRGISLDFEMVVTRVSVHFAPI